MSRWVQFALFFAVVILVYGGTHLYVYRRLVSALGLRPGGLLWALRGATVLLALSFVLARLLAQVLPHAIATILYWGATLWMGAFLFLFMITLALHLLTLALGWTGLRKRLEKALGFPLAPLAVGVALLGTLGLSAVAVEQAQGDAQITRLDVPIPGLPPSLEGFTIAQLSDIHLDLIIHAHRLNRMVDQANALQADLVVITGDLVDGDASHMAELQGPLSRLHGRYGVLAITGNHEYYAGVEEVVRYAKAAGIPFLQNERLVVADKLHVYGINDPTAKRFGYASPAFEEVIGPEAMTEPAILLYHQPLHLERAASLGVNLMLSGHTHKGQIWPLSYISRLIYPCQGGLYVRGDTHLYVSRGMGTWGPPMRLDSPPELVLFTLRRAPGAELPPGLQSCYILLRCYYGRGT